MSQFYEPNAKNFSAKIFRKRELLRSFNKKHSKIFALHVLVFLLEVKNCNYNFGFFWFEPIPMRDSEYIFCQCCLGQLLLRHYKLFHCSFIFPIQFGFGFFQWSSTCALGVSIEFRFDRYESNFLIVFEFSSKNSISYRYDIEFSQP